MNTSFTNAALVACLTFSVGPRAQEVVTVPDAVMADVGETLPERPNAVRKLIVPAWSPNVVISSPCQVRVVLLWEGAGYQNTVGWFLWRRTDTGIVISDADLLFPNASFSPQGDLQTGSAAWVRDASGARMTLDEGDNLGFFLISDGWRRANSIVQNWTRGGQSVPTTDPSVNASVGRGTFTTIDHLITPRASGGSDRKFAMLRMEGRPDFLAGRSWFLCGIEDLPTGNRRDDDYNDVVLAVDVQPAAAAAETDVPGRDKTDLDRDGVRGIDDLYPLDAERAWVRSEPGRGLTVVAFEDFYPTRTDSDFNDAVLAFRFVTVTSSSNEVKEIFGEFHLVARGASFEHAFGLRVPGIPDGATGSLEIQRFLSGAAEVESLVTRQLIDTVRQGRRIDDLFPSTRQALPRATADKPFANTWPGHPEVPAASVRVRIVFDTPVDQSQLGVAPFDPYLMVTAEDGTRADVHLPGFESFPDRSPGLPVETGRTAFIHTDGSAWALLVPAAWRFPMEGVPIRRAYPEFDRWQNSGGRQSKTWYLSPSTEPDLVSVPIDELIPQRDWDLDPPVGTY